jgi:hypothetical protein
MPAHLEWTEKEAKELQKRILSLEERQIAELIGRVGLIYTEKPVTTIAKNMKKNDSVSDIIYEADSKENLLKWLEYFEKEKRWWDKNRATSKKIYAELKKKK